MMQQKLGAHVVVYQQMEAMLNFWRPTVILTWG
jgi:hypothetical protein